MVEATKNEKDFQTRKKGSTKGTTAPGSDLRSDDYAIERRVLTGGGYSIQIQWQTVLQQHDWVLFSQHWNRKEITQIYIKTKKTENRIEGGTRPIGKRGIHSPKGGRRPLTSNPAMDKVAVAGIRQSLKHSCTPEQFQWNDGKNALV